MVVEVGQWHAMTAAPMALGYPGHAIVMEISGHRFDPAAAGKTLAPFAPAISRDDELPAKPDPAAFARIASAWGAAAPSGELLMVGDSPANDVAFGKAAGAAQSGGDSPSVTAGVAPAAVRSTGAPQTTRMAPLAPLCEQLLLLQQHESAASAFLCAEVGLAAADTSAEIDTEIDGNDNTIHT